MVELKEPFSTDVSYITSTSTVNFISDLGVVNSAGNDYDGVGYIPVIVSGTSINALSLATTVSDWTLEFSYYSKVVEDKNPLLTFGTFCVVSIIAASNELNLQ